MALTAILQDLRRHFRRFLQVRDEGGRRMLFRFYDPRVLRVYLPTCHAEELRKFFGPVDRYVVAGETTETLLAFHRAGPDLIQEVVDVSGSTPVQHSVSRAAASGAMGRDSGASPHRPEFRIRDEQMETFRDRMARDFVARLMQSLRVKHPFAVEHLDDEALRAGVVRGIARARAYGLTWQSSLRAFVELTFVVAPEFDRQPAIRKVLTDRRVRLDGRIDLLKWQVTDYDWAEAALLEGPADQGPDAETGDVP